MNKSLMQIIEKKILEKYKTIKDFSYDSGIDYQKLINLKNRNSEPDLKTLSIICNKLDLDANELLGIKLIEENKIKELEKEIEMLKKSISECEEENINLKTKNTELLNELLEKFRELQNSQKQLEKLKLNHN